MQVRDEAAARDPASEMLEEIQARALRDPQPAAVCVPDAGEWTLELSGTLPPGWCGNLSLHCSAAGIDIVRGTARRVRAGRWAARFALASTPSEMDLAGFDYLHMVRRRPGRAGRSQRLVLETVRVEPDPAGDGPLAVHVRAPDRLGLLADLLDRFTFFGLHPERLVLDTRDGVADDAFWLSRVGGGAPSTQIVGALRRSLAEHASGSS